MDFILLFQSIHFTGPGQIFGLAASLFVIFGCFLTIITGLEQVASRKERRSDNVLLFVTSMIVAVILVNFVFLYGGIHAVLPSAAFLFFSSIYAVGPLNYLYYRSLVDSDVNIVKTKGIHLAPALCMLIVESIFQLQNVSFKRDIVASFASPVENGITEIILLAGGISFVLYQFYFIWLCLQLWNEEGMKTGVRALVIIELYNCLSVVPVGIWMLIDFPELVLVTPIMITSVMITIFLMNNRFPELFMMIEHEIVRKKYERSFLEGIDTDLLIVRLDNLMKGARLYRDYELNLQMLSDKLSLTTHQLSQFLNEKLGMSFNMYINDFRIAEARELLADRSDMTVLQICFHVGFSSKSTFNSVFKNSTGMTPTEYRKENVR